MANLKGSKDKNASELFPPHPNDIRDSKGDLVIPWDKRKYAWVLPGGKICNSRRFVEASAKFIIENRCEGTKWGLNNV